MYEHHLSLSFTKALSLSLSLSLALSLALSHLFNLSHAHISHTPVSSPEDPMPGVTLEVTPPLHLRRPTNECHMGTHMCHGRRLVRQKGINVRTQYTYERTATTVSLHRTLWPDLETRSVHTCIKQQLATHTSNNEPPRRWRSSTRARPTRCRT